MGDWGRSYDQSAPVKRVIPGDGADACPPEPGSETEGEL